MKTEWANCWAPPIRADEARAAWESANLPEDLAALRALQRAASSTQTVTVIVGP